MNATLHLKRCNGKIIIGKLVMVMGYNYCGFWSEIQISLTLYREARWPSGRAVAVLVLEQDTFTP